jgi:hypothetical protein
MQNGDYYIIGIGDYDGTTITKAQTLQEVITELNSKSITPVQTTGESTTDVMSQKAVTDAINNIKVEGAGYTYDPETDSIILGLYDSNENIA